MIFLLPIIIIVFVVIFIVINLYKQYIVHLKPQMQSNQTRGLLCLQDRENSDPILGQWE